MDPYVNNSSDAIALVKERGTDLELMEKRAAKKVDIALNILRISLSVEMFFHDESALFSRTELVLFRKKGETTYVYNWHREFKPLLVEFDPNIPGNFNSCLKILYNNLFNEARPEGFLEPLRRATFWISRSITEENLDFKIVCVFIALESMLTSKDKDRKGEDLAYKMLLLNTWADDYPQWPKDVLNMYGKRSEIVHQGKIGRSTDDDYRVFRRITIDILKKSLTFIESNAIESHNDFIKKLESNGRREEVRSWLESYKPELPII